MNTRICKESAETIKNNYAARGYYTKERGFFCTMIVNGVKEEFILDGTGRAKSWNNWGNMAKALTRLNPTLTIWGTTVIKIDYTQPETTKLESAGLGHVVQKQV